MIRLLHTADLHLDAPLRSLALTDEALRVRVRAAARDALRRVVDHALATDAAALLLAGDVFDREVQSLDAVAFFAAQAARLAERDVPVFMIRGNHDFENRAAQRLPLPGNVHVFGPEGGARVIERGGQAIAVHGVSYDRRGAPASLLERFGPPEPGAINVGLLHTSLAGSAAHDVYAPCAVADLAARGYDYWALGHVHGRTVHAEAPWVVMPGAPQGRHVNEPGPRSATEIRVADGRIAALAEIPTATVVFERVEARLSAEDAAPLDAVALRALEAAAAGLGPEQTLVARLAVTGDAATLAAHRRHAEYWRARIAEAAAEAGAGWIERVDFAPAARPAADAPQGPVAEIAALMRELRGDPAMRHALAGALTEALGHLPAAERRALAADAAAEADLLDRLSAEAVEEIAAALAAGEEPAP